MRIDFARLNHLLIPQSSEARERIRRSAAGRVARPVIGIWFALTGEGQLLAVAALVIGGFGVDVRHTLVYLLFGVVAGLVYASLVASRAFKLAGVRVELTAPPRATVGDAVSFVVTCTNEGTRDHEAVRVRGPFLPWDGSWIADEPTIAALRAGRSARAVLRARFTRRGEHHLDPFTAGAVVPFGLALGPGVETRSAKFVVVPRPANVMRLALPLGRRHQPGGVALASKSGESMDLLGVRPYRPGDPVRDLHARSWARAGYPVVREYQQEHFSRVGVVLDTDTRDTRRLEAAIALCAGIVAKLSRGEALIDVIVIGDRVHDLTVGRSLGFLEQALDLLACVEAARAVEPEALAARLAPYLGRLSTVVLVQLADDPARRTFADRVRGRGVGCTCVIVDDARVEAVERGESLVLA